MLSAKYFEHIPVQNDVNQNIYVAIWEQRSRFHSDDILTSKSIPNRLTTMQLHSFVQFYHSYDQLSQTFRPVDKIS